jgi:predicted LPLAT superfamily acyltransferase
VHRHLYRFAQVLTDRVFQTFQPDTAFEARAHGASHILESARKDKGLICLTAHTGAWDIAASLLKGAGFERKFYMVNYHAAGLRFEDFKKTDAPHILSLKSNEEHAIFRIHEALVAGNTVGLMGDRPLGSRFELVPFLGKLAPFDVTAFRLAAVSQVPVVYAFGFQSPTEKRVYEMNAFPPQYPRYLDNGEDRGLQSYGWVCGYAAALETMVRRYPDQWFNFFPFWSTLPPGEKGAPHHNHLLEDLKRATPSSAVS